ncbi:thiol:disulfide interchange protein DsbG, partial [Salmonella enterica]|nr:thiol:disulfide interchange protein DsbG [Salmonella enterica]
WHDYEASAGKMKLEVPAFIPPAQMKVINQNQQLMDDLGANATPAIYYMNKDKILQQVVGLPEKAQLDAMMGQP